jgi:hypothetical protein
LNPEALATDVGTFERLLDEGRPELAVDSFVGPLMDGFHLFDGAEFERWLDGERARLGQRYSSALETLAEATEKRGDLTAAASWWRKLAAHELYSGRVALRLMRALDAAGDRAATRTDSRGVTAAGVRGRARPGRDGIRGAASHRAAQPRGRRTATAGSRHSGLRNGRCCCAGSAVCTRLGGTGGSGDVARNGFDDGR